MNLWIKSCPMEWQFFCCSLPKVQNQYKGGISRILFFEVSLHWVIYRSNSCQGNEFNPGPNPLSHVSCMLVHNKRFEPFWKREG